MWGARNLTKTIDHLLGKSKDRLSEIYDSKLWEKSSSPKSFAIHSKFDIHWYSSVDPELNSRSHSRSRSQSLERKSSELKNAHRWENIVDLMGSITP